MIPENQIYIYYILFAVSLKTVCFNCSNPKNLKTRRAIIFPICMFVYFLHFQLGHVGLNFSSEPSRSHGLMVDCFRLSECTPSEKAFKWTCRRSGKETGCCWCRSQTLSPGTHSTGHSNNRHSNINHRNYLLYSDLTKWGSSWLIYNLKFEGCPS